MVSRLTCVCRNALEGSRLRRVPRVCNCVLAQKPSLHRACVQGLRALVSKCHTVYVLRRVTADREGPHVTWVPGTGGQMGHLAVGGGWCGHTEGVNKVPLDVPIPRFRPKPAHTETHLTFHVFLRHHCRQGLGQAARIEGWLKGG